jgi:hypothetical protein
MTAKRTWTKAQLGAAVKAGQGFSDWLWTKEGRIADGATFDAQLLAVCKAAGADPELVDQLGNIASDPKAIARLPNFRLFDDASLWTFSCDGMNLIEVT